MIYELYGKLHRFAKKISGRGQQYDFRMISLTENTIVKLDSTSFYNEKKELKGVTEIDLKESYPVENIVPKDSFEILEESFQDREEKHKWGIDASEALKIWSEFVERAKIPEGYRNSGICFAGYILDCESWCLPSWIWTNAAVVRSLCFQEKFEEAKKIADKLLSLQEECGGWIVRNDYNSKGMLPVIAPNDSAYIANNALLIIYQHTRQERYLEAAEKCAKWIMETSREDGLVLLGMNAETGEWNRKNNIVDIGFTAGLFAELFKVTKNIRYREFLERFIQVYIKLFRKNDGSFATGLKDNDEQLGGAFGRGQAWALEGLIPAYEVLQTSELQNIIEQLVQYIIKNQNRGGGWPYNLERKLLGLDCKAVSVIGKNLLKWYPYSNHKDNILYSVEKALEWCMKNTINDESNAKGGIFSYSMEGAVVHHLYTKTAFVYSSAYAIEMLLLLKDRGTNLK